MRHHFLRRAATVILVVAATAQPGALLQQDSPASGPSVVGRLTSFDLSTRVLTIAVGSKQEKVLVPSGASIRRGSQALTAERLAACQGAKVKVRFHRSGETRVADSVMVADQPK